MMIRLRIADVLEASQSREVHQKPAAHFVSLSTQVLTILRELSGVDVALVPGCCVFPCSSR